VCIQRKKQAKLAPITHRRVLAFVERKAQARLAPIIRTRVLGSVQRNRPRQTKAFTTCARIPLPQ
jgi:hypothetical protein